MCLVERDCDITIGDNSGNLPIHFAAWHDHIDSLRFLVKQGSSMEFTQAEGKAAAHMVRTKWCQPNNQMEILLIECLSPKITVFFNGTLQIAPKHFTGIFQMYTVYTPQYPGI